MVMEESRRRRRRQRETLLPLRTRRSLSNTCSFWYCDYKFSSFNQSLFRFGRTNSRFLRVWFSIGVGFSLTALLGTTMICAWESARALHLLGGNAEGTNIMSSFLFGFAPSVSGFSITLADAGYILISSLISIAAHEFGHAAAAASEGVQMEYIALFLAVLFPGVLVAFNNELLQALPRQAALRVYCAGIWHNAVCCAVSGLVLFLLPFVLYPLYRYGESPMVLDVSSTSPLSGYLSRGDVILYLDGTHIHNAQEWIDILALMDERALQYSNASEDYEHFMKIKSQKGYCVPRYLMEQNNKIYDSQSACPGELPPFTMVSCFGSRVLDDGSNEDDQYERKESRYCLTAKDIIKLKKCGDGWVGVVYNGSSCICPQDESCLTPIQMPGMSWVEITYSSSYSGDCLRLGRVSFSSSGSDENREIKCGGTFIFVGDVSFLAHSVRLTAYAPRWAFSFGANIPNMLERILICTFYVSLGLAFLNSLLVKFLDGESILEVTLNFLPLSLVSQRKKETVLQLCLLAGTLISILGFLRIFLINIL